MTRQIRHTIIGVMGGAKADKATKQTAYTIGRLIAENGLTLLNGGRAAGVMDESARGACEAGGLTIGVLPDKDCASMSKYIQVPILTGMGIARNTINILSSDVVVALKGTAGTISEVALALNSGQKVILLDFEILGVFERYVALGSLHYVKTPEECIELIKKLLEPK